MGLMASWAKGSPGFARSKRGYMGRMQNTMASIRVGYIRFRGLGV